MKRFLILMLLLLTVNFSYAQWVEHTPLLSTPQFLPIGQPVAAVNEMNEIIEQYIPAYSLEQVDSNNRERIYTYANPVGAKIRVLYTYGVNTSSKLINRISINGGQDDIVNIYNGYFNTDRVVNSKKHTYQLDFFEYKKEKYHARMDPEIDNDKVISWSIYIGKY